MGVTLARVPPDINALSRPRRFGAGCRLQAQVDRSAAREAAGEQKMSPRILGKGRHCGAYRRPGEPGHLRQRSNPAVFERYRMKP
jgi:hypothetical protein